MSDKLVQKIIQGLREAAAYARDNPGKFRISNYRVHITKDRAVIRNDETGSVSIMPTKVRSTP